MAKIYVNGDAQEVGLPLNVSELIQQQNVLQPEMVSVQVNEEFAEREDWDIKTKTIPNNLVTKYQLK